MTGTIKEAEIKLRAAIAAKQIAEQIADRAEQVANAPVLSPAQRKANEARVAAEKAHWEAREASAVLYQARLDKVLESKLGRKLREGEYARRISGDRSNLRAENIEPCSARIEAIERQTGRHVKNEELEQLDEAS